MASPLFDRSIARVCRRGGTMRIHAMRMLSLGAEATRDEQGWAACRWPFSLPWRRTEIPAHPVLTAALCRSSDIILYQERSASESSSWLMGVPALVRVTATGHLIELGSLHIRDFYYPGPLCLRNVARHFAAPRQSAAAIHQTGDRARGISRMTRAAPSHTS